MATHTHVTSPAQTVTLRNSGAAPLTISTIALTGTNAAAFARTAPPPAGSCASTFPTTLAEGASCVSSLTYTPTATAAQTATFQVTDDAVGSPHSVGLQGSGSASAASTVTAITRRARFGPDLVQLDHRATRSARL